VSLTYAMCRCDIVGTFWKARPMPVDLPAKMCAPAIASIWGREGWVGKGLSKLKISVNYFAIYNLEDNCYCTSPKYLISIVSRAVRAWIHTVFESPVRCSLFVPSTLDRNHNRSFQIEKPQRTGPNCKRLVFCSLLQLQDWFWPVLVLTGLQLV